MLHWELSWVFFAGKPVSCTRWGCCYSSLAGLCLLSFKHPGWPLDALGGKIFLLLVQVIPAMDLFVQSHSVMLHPSNGRTWLSWNLGSIYVCKWEEGGKPVTGKTMDFGQGNWCVCLKSWEIKELPCTQWVNLWVKCLWEKNAGWRALSSGIYCVLLSL